MRVLGQPRQHSETWSLEELKNRYINFKAKRRKKWKRLVNCIMSKVLSWLRHLQVRILTSPCKDSPEWDLRVPISKAFRSLPEVLCQWVPTLGVQAPESEQQKPVISLAFANSCTNLLDCFLVFSLETTPPMSYQVQAAITKYQTRQLSNNSNSLLTVVEPEKFKNKVWEDTVRA